MKRLDHGRSVCSLIIQDGHPTGLHLLQKLRYFIVLHIITQMVNTEPL